jgi:hypothetical protein
MMLGLFALGTTMIINLAVRRNMYKQDRFGMKLCFTNDFMSSTPSVHCFRELKFDHMSQLHT